MTEITLQQAIEKLSKELSKDKSQGSYYYSWQANISMAMLDSFVSDNLLLSGSRLYTFYHAAANEGAKRFLDMLIADHHD